MRLAFSILDLAARLLFALGVGCLLLGAYLSWQTWSFERDAVRASGEVVSYLESRDAGETRYRPRIRFRTTTGDIVTVAGQLSSSSQRFAIGAQVPVDYKVSNPTEARLALFTYNWLGACVAAAMGLTGVVGGFLVRRSIGRELKKRPA